MLLKKHRVNTKNIDQIFKQSRFLSSNNLTFKFFYIKEDKNIQISFIAPKSVAKSAVKRNLLRRRGYIALKDFLGVFPPGIKGVFVFTKDSLGCFGGKNTNEYKPILNLKDEIKKIISKIN